MSLYFVFQANATKHLLCNPTYVDTKMDLTLSTTQWASVEVLWVSQVPWPLFAWPY